MKTKKTKQPLVPALRFPEFGEDGEWEEENGNILFEAISNKNHNSDLPILAITQDQGAIPRDMIDYHVTVSEKSVKSYKVVEVGDFIISLRSFQGGIEYSEYKGICSPAYIILRKRNLEDVNEFYKFYLKTKRFIKDLNRNLEGIRDGKMVSYKQFSEIKIARAYPKEQQKIADCLRSLDQLIGAHEIRLEHLKNHKKGLMQQLFPQEGEKVPRLRFPEFKGDGEWEEKELGSIAKVTTGNKDTKNKVDNGQYPFFVRSQSVERIDSYSFDGEAILTSGDGVGVGKNFHYIMGKFDFHQRVYAIYDFTKGVLGKYIFMYFSQYFYDRVMKMSAKNSVDSVRKAMITEMLIMLPSPKEQQKIADCLSSLDTLIAAEAQKIAALGKHKKGLMQQLFPEINR